jgi:hypothetical protein
MVSLSEMVQATEDHLQRNTIEGQHEFFGDRIAQINQEGEEQPGRPDLQEDAVLRTCPQVSQVEQAFDGQESFFDSPAPSIQIGDYIGWQEV